MYLGWTKMDEITEELACLIKDPIFFFELFDIKEI